MKPLTKLVGAALLGALTLLAAPNAQAQVGVNIHIGPPSWGPQVPYGTQYYYIPEIDGYYDLYSQQYIVFQEGYWVPLPELYGYDPYQFHPVIVDYRGPQPWSRIAYYRQRYAYQPYRAYPRSGYYANGYGPNYPNGGYYGRGRGYYGHGHGYNDHDHDAPRRNPHPDSYGGGGYNGPRGGQNQYSGYGGNPRSSQPQGPQPQQPEGYGSGQGNSAPNGHGQQHGPGQGGGRHGRD